MITNFIGKTCLNLEIIKISNLIEVKIKNNACPRPKFNRRPNLFESRIFPKAEFIRKPNVPNSEVPKCGLNTRHDNREVTLTYLTQAQIVRSDKWATGSIHTNGSMSINVIPC